MSKQNEIINIEFNSKRFSLYDIYKNYLENLFELFYLILKEDSTGFWWESIALILEYLQLLTYIIDEKVSKSS
jgi:hypothetical protein